MYYERLQILNEPHCQILVLVREGSDFRRRKGCKVKMRMRQWHAKEERVALEETDRHSW